MGVIDFELLPNGGRVAKISGRCLRRMLLRVYLHTFVTFFTEKLETLVFLHVRITEPPAAK